MRHLRFLSGLRPIRSAQFSVDAETSTIGPIADIVDTRFRPE
jgi:hypothetical protein